MRSRYIKLPLLFLFFIAVHFSNAQLTLTGQFRTRTEFRDGQGTLPERNSTPSFFTSQRTRLNIGYATSRLKFFTAIQDIRVWGMDASSISNMDGSRLFIHEAWGEIIFNDSSFLKKINNLSLKLGRQEISYDDQRLLGNLDWLQQARRHDAAILKFNNNSYQADIGVAFNQDKEKKNAGTIYAGVPVPQIGADGTVVSAPAGTNNIGFMYKSIQYLYLAKSFKSGKLTYLFFKDDFQKYSLDTLKNKVYRKGVNSRITTGLAAYCTVFKKHRVEAYGYYQGNKDKDGLTMDAYMAGANFTASTSKKSFVTIGVDYLTGNNVNDNSKVDRRFDPLYGTPHKYWGFLDYFYVADAYGVNVGTNAAPVLINPGLVDYFLKLRYQAKDKLTAGVDLHEFFAASEVADRSSSAIPGSSLNKHLGLETDVILQYNINKQILLEAGYSLMLGTNTLDALKLTSSGKAGEDKRNNGNWAYLMINIRPDLLAEIKEKLLVSK